MQQQVCNLHLGRTQFTYSAQLALVVLFLVALAHILHAQIATCTVMMVHGGGSGVMEVVPWDSSMWWLYINIIIFGHGHYRCMVMLAVHVFVCGSQCWQLCTCALACLWQDSVQIPYHHLSHHM